MSISVISKGKSRVLNNVLFCYSLLDLGIEIVNGVEYDIGDNEYMLDGEIIYNIAGINVMNRSD